jgi:hypothetical protein
MLSGASLSELRRAYASYGRGWTQCLPRSMLVRCMLPDVASDCCASSLALLLESKKEGDLRWHVV